MKEDDKGINSMKLWQQVTSTALLLWGGGINAANLPLGGVPVNITLTNQPQITVEKPGGGWYDTLMLNNSAGSDTRRYQTQVPVQVSIRNERRFMVSLVNPLVLTHETNTSLTFITEHVSFGGNPASLFPLSMIPTDFSAPPISGDVSTGNYLLSVSVRQPIGEWRNISGNYQGKLVLLFEVKV